MNTAKSGRDLQTRTGLCFHVRPVNPGDEAALREFFAQVTADDLRFRFLSSVKVVSHGQLASMIDVDHRQLMGVGTQDLRDSPQDFGAFERQYAPPLLERRFS